MRVLVTGAAGFVGKHLVDDLVAKGENIFGVDQTSLGPHAIAKGVTYLQGNLCKTPDIERALMLSQPDIVFHLAGVTKCKEVQDFYYANVVGTASLLAAAQRLGMKPTIFVASSSAVYGAASLREPITERCRTRPITHYGASKAAEELVARHGFLAYGLPTVCARTFNLIGPYQSSSFACSDFAYQIALAEINQSKRTVETGNLSTRRDFVDVRDAVSAYDLIANRGKPGVVYNVCSGRSIAIGECLRTLLGMAKVRLDVIACQSRMQKNDIPVQTGSAARLYKQTGWKPRIPIRQSLNDLLDYWREDVRSARGEA
jgi:GDP-4-dehydro-6-deoxy-D-mannose reductase